MARISMPTMTMMVALMIAWALQGVFAQEMDPVEAMGMSFKELAATRGVDADELAAELGLPPETDLNAPTGELLKESGLSLHDLQSAVQSLRSAAVSPAGTSPDVIAAEAADKDWSRIRLKFALWAAFFIVALILLMRRKVSRKLRIVLLVAAPLIFGVWLGIEPNAPGTVKDGIMLYARSGRIFLPRLVALIALLLMSIVGNKIFCGWGCQFGTLQDLVWHLPTRKFKPPFRLSNIVRVGFLAVFTIVAFTAGTDIIEPLDPFRVFRLGAAAAVAAALVILVVGIWIYRPWCTFFCPFGLVSWLGERIAITKPRVNLDTCIDCRRCERECPTSAIEGLRRCYPLPQDCFACGTCIRVCPVDAIRWHLTPPPAPDTSDGIVSEHVENTQGA